MVSRSRNLKPFPYLFFIISTHKPQSDGHQDYTSYTDCLTRYYSLETETKAALQNYTRRYRQLLMQIFSSDSVLQLVSNAAISLLFHYSTDEVIDERLSSLIPALSMIFINTLTDCTDSLDLRKLSGALAQRAKLTFNDLVNNRDVIRSSHDSSSYSPRE